MLIHSRYKIVRGAYDLGAVVNRRTARSKYGGSYFSISVPRLSSDNLYSEETENEVDRLFVLVSDRRSVSHSGYSCQQSIAGANNYIIQEAEYIIIKKMGC